MDYFSGIKIDDKVWDVVYGWGEVVDIEHNDIDNFKVKFEKGRNYENYDFNGVRYGCKYCNQTLFWDEVRIEAPDRPMIELEDDYSNTLQKAYFQPNINSFHLAKRFTRLLALRDQECPDSRDFNNPRWGDEVYYIVYNRETYDGIENPYEVKSTIHTIPECAVLFKTEKDAQKICSILNSKKFILEK